MQAGLTERNRDRIPPPPGRKELQRVQGGPVSYLRSTQDKSPARAGLLLKNLCEGGSVNPVELGFPQNLTSSAVDLSLGAMLFKKHKKQKT